jgi:hypothetical protein
VVFSKAQAKLQVGPTRNNGGFFLKDFDGSFFASKREIEFNNRWYNSKLIIIVLS